MAALKLSKVTAFVDEHIVDFHAARLASLKRLALTTVLKRKNPYLFKAKYVIAAPDLVRTVLDAHLSSQEETLFGSFLEELAIFVCDQTYGGKKAVAEGIDLVFQRDDITFLVVIKSGPNWGNSSQISKMKADFAKAVRIYKTNNRRAVVEYINGCCYGIDSQPDKDGYQKLCGQRFWSFLSGNPDLYLDIIEPLGHKAKERNDEFAQEYAKLQTRLTLEFARDFCETDGAINWNKLVQFNSGANR
ncbi:MAG: cytosolic protein [Anaerolineales bacterium]|nr:cytosolic protein [Anaerolineales bacterium]